MRKLAAEQEAADKRIFHRGRSGAIVHNMFDQDVPLFEEGARVWHATRGAGVVCFGLARAGKPYGVRFDNGVMAI